MSSARSGVARRLALTVGAATLSAAAATGLFALAGDGLARPWLAATAVAVAGVAVTLPVLIDSLRRPAAVAGPRVMGVGMLRAAVTLGGGLAAVRLLGLPPRATMGFVLAYHLALLAAEAWASASLVARAPAATVPAPAGDPTS